MLAAHFVVLLMSHGIMMAMMLVAIIDDLHIVIMVNYPRATCHMILIHGVSCVCEWDYLHRYVAIANAKLTKQLQAAQNVSSL